MHNHDELTHWLTLTQLPEAGAIRVQQLFAYFKTAKNICMADRRALKRCQLNDAQMDVIKKPNVAWIDQSLDWISKNDQHIVTMQDKRYPNLLKEIYCPPILLFVKGDVDLLSAAQIAMVGSRNPSPTGLELAREFAFDFAKAGLCVTSGLALGIDGASHEGALKARGKTIAVLGAGLHHIYPKRHVKLAEQIAAEGALVSEFPLQIAPMSKNFPRRNRIVSGLSLGTLIVEAALKSGSLITANYALEQNRDVFAIPGSVRNATSCGCLSLIQQGAACVTCAHDVLKALSYAPQKTNNRQWIQSVNTTLPLDCQERQVLACIDDVLTTVDQICARCRLSAQIVSAALLQLELKAVIRRHYGGYIKINE